MITEDVISTKINPSTTSRSCVLSVIANPAKAPPRASEPTSPINIFAGDELKIRKPETNGLVIGKEAMREWWKDAFDRLPTLHYKVTSLTANTDRVFMEYVRSVENEEDMLDRAWGLSPQSRLSCQAIVAKTDLVIEIPKYSINHAKENH